MDSVALILMERTAMPQYDIVGNSNIYTSCNIIYMQPLILLIMVPIGATIIVP
jgi:hypothetical protein